MAHNDAVKKEFPKVSVDLKKYMMDLHEASKKNKKSSADDDDYRIRIRDHESDKSFER